jgi:hypothetical protein
MPEDAALAMRHRARASARRFDEGVFAQKWIAQMQRLIDKAPARINTAAL